MVGSKGFTREGQDFGRKFEGFEHDRGVSFLLESSTQNLKAIWFRSFDISLKSYYIWDCDVFEIYDHGGKENLSVLMSMIEVEDIQ